jgi:hypothetical protein
MLLDELRFMINKSKFPEILKKWGFQEVFSWDAGAKHHDESLIGYESSICRISFFWGDLIAVAVSLGTKSDDFTHKEGSNWVGIDLLSSYLLKKPIEKDKQINNNIPRDDRLIKELSETANTYDSLAEKINPMFLDSMTVAGWLPALEKYIRDENKRLYGI